MTEKKHVFAAWFSVILCILGIFLIAPFARIIQEFVSSQWSRSVFGYVVLAATLVGFSLLFYVLLFRFKIRRFRQYFWLILILGTYIYFTLSLWDAPEEAVHFLYYGLLGYFLLRALRFHIRDKSIYFTVFFIGSLVGMVDEIIQWILPDRFWDIRDVGLNALACLLFLIAVWAGIRPKMFSSKISESSVRITAIFFAVNLILFGLCFSNTPQRIQSYAKAIPFLSFLEKEEAMSEFKHKHKDPDIGVFYSRLELEEIARIDREKAYGTAKVLEEWKTKSYREYLRTFPGHVHPFLYEIRVHIFRRDRMMERAGETDDLNLKKENIFIALMENRILEKYYGESLRLSSYAWSEEKKGRIAAKAGEDGFYRSPVSAGVFSGVKESTMWLVIFILIASLIGGKTWYFRKQRRTS